MVANDRFKASSRDAAIIKKILITSAIAVVVIGIIVGVVMVIRSGVFDTAMRLRLVEGTVNIEDASGAIKSASSNSSFESGDTIGTSYDGMASIVLDNSKTVSLDGYSRASFFKQGKTLEVSLIKGGLFFEVSGALNDDESFAVKTTNLTINITKGSSGYIFYDESGLQSLIVTDGVVRVDATNKKTGQKKNMDVHGGQKLSVYLYDKSSGSGDSVKLVATDIRPKDLPYFPLRIMSKNATLLANVSKYTGWDESEIQYYINALPAAYK